MKNNDRTNHMTGSIMKIMQIAAAVLIVTNLLALTQGGFTYTKETLELTPGLLMLIVEGQQQAHIPAWACVGGIFIGGLLILFTRLTPKYQGFTPHAFGHKE